MLCLPQQRPSPPIAPPRSCPGLAGNRSSPPPGSGAWWHGTARHGARLALRRRGPRRRGLSVRCGLQRRDVSERSKCATLSPFTVLTVYLQGIPCWPIRLPCCLLPSHSCLLPSPSPRFHILQLKYLCGYTFNDSYLI